MSGLIQGFRARARAQAEELLAAIDAAEAVIVTTIERECEALRAGRMLAASALHTRLCDAARLYLEATQGGAREPLDHRAGAARHRGHPGGAARKFLARCSKVEFAVLAAERAAAGGQPLRRGFDDAPRGARATPLSPARRRTLESARDCRQSAPPAGPNIPPIARRSPIAGSAPRSANSCPPAGQRWTSLEALARTHSNAFRQHEPDVLSLVTRCPPSPSASAPSCFCPKHGNVLWDCIALLDEATVTLIRALGGLKAIAISHPHLLHDHAPLVGSLRRARPSARGGPAMGGR